VDGDDVGSLDSRLRRPDPACHRSPYERRYLLVDSEYDSAALGSSDELMRHARALMGALDDQPAHLLGRTDAGLMVAAVAASMWPAGTTVARAPTGRRGWRPPPGAVLVEPVPIGDGLSETLSALYPALRIVVTAGCSSPARVAIA
jgi:hypothetical protein